MKEKESLGNGADGAGRSWQGRNGGEGGDCAEPRAPAPHLSCRRLPPGGSRLMEGFDPDHYR